MIQENECKSLDHANKSDKVTNTNERLHWHCLQHEGNLNCTNECVLQNALKIFGKKHSMSIIRALLRHNKLRFNKLLDAVGGSPKTLTKRLRELEEHGLLDRETYDEIPPRVEYSLTKPGKDLEDIFERISIWAGTWIASR